MARRAAATLILMRLKLPPRSAKGVAHRDVHILMSMVSFMITTNFYIETW
jgi:hypothetical protein